MKKSYCVSGNNCDGDQYGTGKRQGATALCTKRDALAKAALPTCLNSKTVLYDTKLCPGFIFMITFTPFALGIVKGLER